VATGALAIPLRAAAAQLAQRARAREPAAWTEIFEAHYRMVYAFVRSRVRSPADAEDLASQVFEVAYSRADHFEYRGVPIEAWLVGIARNVVRDHLKKLGRRGETVELQEALMPSADATATLDLRHDLALAMRALTEDQQTVLTLRFSLDCPVAETARLMRRSEDAVKNLQRRALASMKRELERQERKP
jgi:RNA polymerase sigma-70 factor (ECF subfamily)